MSFPQVSGFGFSGTDWPATAVDRNWNLRDAATARQANELAMQRTQEFNSAEAAAQRDWQEEMSNTSWQRGVADMKAAGINPMVAYHAGGASTPTGGTASSSGTRYDQAKPTQFPRAGGSLNVQTASQVAVNEAVEERTRAEADKVRAEEKEVIARTPTHAVGIDKMRQEITESIERIEDIRQRVLTGASSAAQMQQQTENLRAALPQITATIKLLRAQEKQTGALTGKTEEETREIRQRIAQNLPALEAAIRQLDTAAKQLDMPRREQESAQHERFQGAFGALLRILNPLNNFLK